MRHVLGRLSAIALVLIPFSYAAAEPSQTVLGAKFQIKGSATDITKRTVRCSGREKLSDDTLLGDPTVDGATLNVVVNGGTGSDALFDMPAVGWSAVSGGFRFSNKAVVSAVRKAKIQKSASGTFTIKASVDGRYDTITFAAAHNFSTSVSLLVS